MRQIHAILVYLDVTDGNMEEGSMRCDANVSIRPKGDTELYTRAEIKNLNSFRNIQRAIESEIERQIACHEDGIEVVQETRLFDSVKQVTQSMRSKEDAHDYRYFPNPDLPPVVVSLTELEKIKTTLPELPEARKQRFMEEFGITDEDAVVLTAEKEIADYFEQALTYKAPIKRLTALMRTEFLRECAQVGVTPFTSKMTPERMAELATIVENGTISTRMAHDIFPELFEQGVSPAKLAEERGLVQVSDTGELEGIVLGVLQANPDEVEAYKGGKEKLMSFFVGQIMRQTKGKANPGLVSELLKKHLA